MISNTIIFLAAALNSAVASELPVLPIETTLTQVIDKNIENEIQKCRLIVQENSSNNADVLKMFDETINQWKVYALSHDRFDLNILLKATAYAAVKHHGQTRKDAAKTPYIVHPIGVARIAWEEGLVRSTNVLVSALLHDTLEDTDATNEEITSLFGPRVAYTVQELTNSPNLTSQENKERQVTHAPTMSLNAQLVKLSDRLYNLRDLRNPPPEWDAAHVHNYFMWGQKLHDALFGVNENLEMALQDEIDAHIAYDL